MASTQAAKARASAPAPSSVSTPSRNAKAANGGGLKHSPPATSPTITPHKKKRSNVQPVASASTTAATDLFDALKAEFNPVINQNKTAGLKGKDTANRGADSIKSCGPAVHGIKLEHKHLGFDKRTVMGFFAAVSRPILSRNNERYTITITLRDHSTTRELKLVAWLNIKLFPSRAYCAEAADLTVQSFYEFIGSMVEIKNVDPILWNGNNKDSEMRGKFALMVSDMGENVEIVCTDGSESKTVSCHDYSNISVLIDSHYINVRYWITDFDEANMHTAFSPMIVMIYNAKQIGIDTENKSPKWVMVKLSCVVYDKTTKSFDESYGRVSIVHHFHPGSDDDIFPLTPMAASDIVDNVTQMYCHMPLFVNVKVTKRVNSFGTFYNGEFMPYSTALTHTMVTGFKKGDRLLLAMMNRAKSVCPDVIDIGGNYDTMLISAAIAKSVALSRDKNGKEKTTGNKFVNFTDTVFLSTILTNKGGCMFTALGCGHQKANGRSCGITVNAGFTCGKNHVNSNPFVRYQMRGLFSSVGEMINSSNDVQPVWTTVCYDEILRPLFCGKPPQDIRTMSTVNKQALRDMLTSPHMAFTVKGTASHTGVVKFIELTKYQAPSSPRSLAATAMDANFSQEDDSDDSDGTTNGADAK